jgi:hypothetical protein
LDLSEIRINFADSEYDIADYIDKSSWENSNGFFMGPQAVMKCSLIGLTKVQSQDN